MSEEKTVKIPVRIIAKLLAGLLVPRSMNMLGTATGAFDELRGMFNLFGWQNAEEIELKILGLVGRCERETNEKHEGN